MAETITLKLNGSVPLELFAAAMTHLQELVSALTDEVAGPDAEVEWEVSELSAGSAVATFVGSAPEPAVVERVAEAYLSVGTALSTRRPIPYSDTVEDVAYRLSQLVNGHITSLEFATNGEVATVDERLEVEDPDVQPPGTQETFGSIRGVIQTVSDRRNLYFILYDEIFDSAIKCYFESGIEDEVRGAWRRRVEVTGYIIRDRSTGLAKRMRRVTIRVMRDVDDDVFHRLRGILPWEEGDLPSEVAIRRLRDAEDY